MAGAVRKGDNGTGHGCYPPRANTSASADVIINNKGAHRLGDAWAPHGCAICPAHGGSLSSASTTVFTNGKGQGRIGDSVSCGSSAAQGSGNVFIDDGAVIELFNFDADTFDFNNPIISPGLKDALGFDVEDAGKKIMVGKKEVYENPHGFQNKVEVVRQTRTLHTTINDELVEEAIPAEEEEIELDESVKQCNMFVLDDDYNAKISPNFTLSHFTLDPLWPHLLKAQNGRSVNEIICAIQYLANEAAEIVYKTIKDAGYAKPTITSGFRQTKPAHRSQHYYGEAFDIAHASWGKHTGLLDLANKVAEALSKNKGFGQCILETPPESSTGWIHISLSNRRVNKNQRLTFDGKRYLNGFVRV